MNDSALIQAVMNEVLHRLNGLNAQELFLLIGSCEGLILPSEISFHTYEENSSKPYHKILITTLSLTSLGALASGYGVTKADELILEALLADKEVYLLEDGLQYRYYKGKNYNPLYTHYMQCENKLRQYGVKIIKSPMEILKKDVIRPLPLTQKPLQVDEEETQWIDLTHTHLLRESDIVRTNGLTTIKIKHNCIITPLAQDRIQTYQLKIKRV